MKDIQQILSSLGLLDSEIKTYLAALRNGPSPVLDLSKETKLSRQATYTAIEQLSERGLMSTVQREKKQYYVAEDPEKLLAYAKRKEDEVKDRVKDLKGVLPSLKLQVGGEQPVVKVYEGKEGLRVMLEDTKASKPKTLHEITDLSAMQKVLTPEDLAPYRKILMKSTKEMYGINTAKQSAEDQEKIHRITLSPQESQFKSHIGVYADKIALVTFEGKMHTIMVESPALAKAMKKLFELAFSKKKN